MFVVDTASPAVVGSAGPRVGAVAVAVTLAITFLGSDGLVWFDAALVGYLFGSVFAVFGVVYRYSVWLRRPPTAMLNRRGWDAFRQRKARNAGRAAGAGRHPPARPGLHPPPLAGPVAGPPAGVLGLHPRGAGDVPADARAAALRERRPAGRPLPGVPVAGRHDAASTPRASSAGSIFHALDIAAVLVLAGVFIFLRRRLRDPGALAVERSGDFLALAGLFAVSVTGLFLTVSSVWLEGQLLLGAQHAPRAHRDPRADVHPVRQAVPHLPAARQPRRRLLQAGQRRGPAGVVPALRGGVRQRPADRRPQGGAARRSASTTASTDGGSYQDTCPRCRRAQVTLAQSARVGGFG